MNIAPNTLTKMTPKVMAAAAFLCLTLGTVRFAFAQETAPTSGSIPSEFSAPGREYRPHVRMWIPQAAVEESVLRSQIDDLAKAGFGDVEVVAFEPVRRGRNEPSAPAAIDNAVYGWGTPNWSTVMRIILDQVGKRGIKATF